MDWLEGLSTSPNPTFAIEKRRVADVLVVSISGRMTESFDGQALGRELSGLVVFDLERATGITSYAIRTWVDMLNEVRGRVTGLYFARCSPAMIRQINMVRNFTVGGSVLSFYAPYVCVACDTPFNKLFDCSADAEALRTFDAPGSPCPRCGTDGELDDDPVACFAFFANQPRIEVPPSVLAALDMSPGDAEALPVVSTPIEKIVEQRVTRVRVNGRLDGALRWDRITDGLEGHVVFDLRGVNDVVAAGVNELVAMLGRLPPEVDSAYLEACPLLVVQRLATGPKTSRIGVLSAYLTGQCNSCGGNRPALVDVRRGGDALRKDQAGVPCSRCGAPLSFARVPTLVRFLADQQPPALPEPEERVSAAARPVSAPPPSIGTTRAALVVAAAALTTIAIVFAWSSISPPEGVAAPTGDQVRPLSAVAAQPVAAVAPRLLPPWVETELTVTADRVVVVGRGGPAADERSAVEAARVQAVNHLSEHVLSELGGTTLYDFVRRCCGTRGDAAVAARVAQRFQEQVAAIAPLERSDALVRQTPAGVEAFVRYHLPSEALVRAVQFYRRAPGFRGATVAAVFPLLERGFRTEAGAMIVDVRPGTPAATSGLEVGDFVLDVNGRRVYTAYDFGAIVTHEWRRTPVHGRLFINVESRGARRSVYFRKPPPPPPRPRSPAG